MATRHRQSAMGQSARDALDRLYFQFDDLDAATDPVHVVRRFRDPADREVAGFCAAGLAFGRVASVLSSVESLLAVMGDSPAAFVRSFDPHKDRRRIEPLGHRWVRGDDLVALLWILRQMIETEGSIEGFFLRGYRTDAEDIGPALDDFSLRARAVDLGEIYPRQRSRKGVAYFFPRPSDGSACKRLNLYLRWMVRKDRIDFGVWSRVDAAKLVIPLDTHVIRVGRCLRLTRYRSPGWAMARDITRSLRKLDPSDPVKYDFSLCHLGMQSACGFNEPQRDDHCPLRGVCRPHGNRPQRRPQPSGRR